MSTRMLHANHGATNAYDQNEILRLKKLGWVVEGEEVTETPVPGDAPETVVPKRRGRPPKAG
jgi:hypothetical protein